MRATVADPGWLDPSTLHLQCLVTNTASLANSFLVPLAMSTDGAFFRGRLLSGQVIEDVLEMARVSHLNGVLQPLAKQQEIQKLGFAGKPIAQTKSKRVLWAPRFGLPQQDKWILPNRSPLTFEFALGAAGDWVAGGTSPVVVSSAMQQIANSSSWECFLVYDILTLDAEIQSSYASVLRQG